MKPGVVINIDWPDNGGLRINGIRRDGVASVQLLEPVILAVFAQILQIAMLQQAEGMKAAKGPAILRATGPLGQG